MILHMASCFQSGNRDGPQDDEEYDDVEEDDREKFNDQLCSIGTFGTHIPAHSLPLLTRCVCS